MTHFAVLNEPSQAMFQREGYVITRQLFAVEEIIELAHAANALLERQDLIDQANRRCRWQNHHETGECRFDCFDPVIDLHPVIEHLARDERLTQLVAELYGEPAFLLKDKLIYKPPGATGYGLHQDYIAWPSFPRSFVTVLVPIDAASDDNGAVEVFPGYHANGCLSPEDGEYHELDVSLVDESQGVRLHLEPGDVAVFHGMLPHRSAANHSPNWRRQLYLSFNAASDGGEQRETHYRDFQTWLAKKYAEYGKHGTYFA